MDDLISLTVAVKDEKDSESVDLNVVDSGLKEEIKSFLKEEIKSFPVAVDDTCRFRVSDSDLSNKVAVECENRYENDCKKVADNNDEGGPVVEKGKRGRKRKNLESSEVKVNSRVLRSRTATGSLSVKVEDVRLIESVVGFKRQMEAECLDQTDIRKEGGKKSPLKSRPQKKQKHKRRGRPPKNQGEAVFKRKKGSECVDQTELQNEVNERSQLTDKKGKCVGKPPKDLEIKNFKPRGRPPKVQAGNMSTTANNPNVKVVKENKNLLKAKDVKTVSKIQKVENDDQASEITGDMKQKAKITKERNDHTIAEETAKGDNNTKPSNNITSMERRKGKQLVKDKIVSIIMKAGWTIEYRPRENRAYLDAVYVDLDGGTSWSCTKAYFSLKSKITNKTATSREVSAFIPIPDDEMSMLFKVMTKVRSDKNVKKKKRGENVSKAEIVFSEEAPPPKNKPGRKKKDGKKRKEIKKSSVKPSNKLPKVRGPKVSQKVRQIRKPHLVVRGSSKRSGQENDEDNALYTGKRNLLSWMIDAGVIKPDDKLRYGEGRRRNGLHEGTVSCDGVHCSCCAETMDLLKFVSHVGGKATQGLESVYLQSGLSLLKCLLESWRKEEDSSKIRFNFVDVKGDDPSDDTCNICGDGGDLICCDGCPSTFHQSCLDIQNFPSGVWRCIYCCCKFCGLVECGASQKDDSRHPANSEMATCCLCEEKFHNLCLQEEDAVKADSTSLSFCGKKCQEIHEQLQTYLGVKFELEEGYSWTLLNRSDVSQAVAVLDDRHKIECNSKLAVAFSVMDECFEPIIDERSGVNKIHNVVFNCGSNFKRLNYSRFLTAVLEKGGELISTASIRIHGNQLAEMPFIGTRNMYRRQGMCRRLLDAIENALSSLGVEELVIPAISELHNTWTKVFGFKPLEESIKQAMKGMSMVVFPGTDMLQKRPLQNQFADKNQRLAAMNDNNALDSEVKSSNATDCLQTPGEDATHLESETPTTSFQAVNDSDEPSSNVLACEDKVIAIVNKNDVTEFSKSPLTSKVILKNTFDLNLAATDADILSIDDETLSRDTQVCKKSFDLSDSKSLVLV